MRSCKVCVVALVSLVSAGCDDNIDLDPLDTTPPVEARVRPRSIIGGTLTMASGDIAVAADPDRDLVHIVDVGAQRVRRTIALEPGDEPARVIVAENVAHIVLRGFGGIASIDLATDTLLARTPVCAEPRGIAFDPIAATLHVACADGSLFELDAATRESLGSTQHDPDLRDVMIVDGEVQVSQFRSGAILDRAGHRRLPTVFGDLEPRVAWRSIYEPNTGSVVVLHQLLSTASVPIQPGSGGDDGGGGGGDLPYGGGGGCSPPLSGPALSIMRGDEVTTFPLLGAPMSVDVALSSDGSRMALAMPGAEPGRSSLRVGGSSFEEAGFECGAADDGPDLGQITAVAFALDDTVVVAQSREPAQLVIMRDDGHAQDFSIIALEGGSRFDTGHEIFHRKTESGLSCASCHPEGTDDGFVWRFEGLGPRRTQPLDVELAGSAPFHWDGDMPDLDVLMSEVLAHRMGGERQSPERSESFASWLFAQGRPAVRPTESDAAEVARGEALFASNGCARCHDGAQLGGARTESFRGAALQVPSLRRVSLRPPFMHDGRSVTLRDAVIDMVDGTLDTAVPSDDIDAMVAFLRTR
ncbi:MAG: c-type cytochrome [Deltaproteobacteria bacterium]|nr:c-type cytochrome [Nannocystaceae bacterium]